MYPLAPQELVPTPGMGQGLEAKLLTPVVLVYLNYVKSLNGGYDGWNRDIDIMMSKVRQNGTGMLLHYLPGRDEVVGGSRSRGSSKAVGVGQGGDVVPHVVDVGLDVDGKDVQRCIADKVDLDIEG